MRNWRDADRPPNCRKARDFRGCRCRSRCPTLFRAGGELCRLLGTAWFLAGAAAHATTGHFGVNVVEFVGERLGGKDPARRQQNRDLQRLIGEAIARVLERASVGAPGGKAGRNYLKNAAAEFPRQLDAFEPTGTESGLGRE